MEARAKDYLPVVLVSTNNTYVVISTCNLVVVSHPLQNSLMNHSHEFGQRYM
jgi:hypothetical protein